MAGWTAHSLSIVNEILRKLQSVGFCPESDIDEFENVSSLFNRVLSVFLTEIHPPPDNGSRPVPAMIGDGRPVDFFRLFFAVRENGGFNSVSTNKGWSSVAEAIGSDPGLASSVKLVYTKYLDDLDRWLNRILVNNDDHDDDSNNNDNENKKWKKEKEFLTPITRRVEEDGNGASESDPEPANAMGLVLCNNKRKRGDAEEKEKEVLAEMLNWLLWVAKNPGDDSIGIGRMAARNALKAKAKVAPAVREVYSQVVSARQALFLKKIPNPEAASWQKGHRVHPSIYDDVASEKVSSSKRFHSISRQSDSGLGSESSALRDSDMDNNYIEAGVEVDHGKRKLRNSSLLFDTNSLLSKDRKRIPVGTSFQAMVPAWTDKASAVSDDADDLKWLGTPIWPPENQGRPPVEQSTIGKGRQDSCMCKYPSSVECVRFHVAEKRFQLKLELGSTFHAWQFYHMGEEVALRWTKEEEQKFKAIVRLNPLALNKNFWDHLYLLFPFKGRKNLVSYYFNVFLLARRSYQNRLTPNSIDSDDEETEFGFLSKPFGHDAIKMHTPRPIFCAQNAQCMDLDD